MSKDEYVINSIKQICCKYILLKCYELHAFSNVAGSPSVGASLNITRVCDPPQIVRASAFFSSDIEA